MQDIGVTKLEKLGDDKSVNFRPSPNFKDMKKYFKSKFEEAGCSGTTGFPASIEQELAKEVDNKANITVAVQPPLPPGTPPPDYPANLVLKKEVIDYGYENNTSEQQTEAGCETYDKAKPAQTESIAKSKIMCKDFVRGTCKRVPCNYKHKLDLTQLKGVYKFCRDFANGKCKRPVCFFVHATTFEKENFFRTGSLPPHTLSHLKDPAIAQQPQSVSEAPAQPCMPMYPVNSANPANPANPNFKSCAPLPPPIITVSSAVPPVDAGLYSMYSTQPPPQPQTASPPKHNWNEVSGLARDHEIEAAKKCINCKLSEIRYQQNQAKLEGIEKSTKKIKENIVMLDKKKAKLMAILRMVLWKDMPN